MSKPSGFTHVLTVLGVFCCFGAGLSTTPSRAAETNAPEVGMPEVGGTPEVRRAAEVRGAAMPYTEYEAEAGTTNAGEFGPDRTYLTVAAEASGRRGVRLDETGDYVEFELTEPTNSIVVRHSIPDSADGAGMTAPLSVYANGNKLRDIGLSSVYSWVYGEYPYTNDPSQGDAHRFFDESRARFDEELPAGTTLRLQKDDPTAAYYDIDLIDTELVDAPAQAPTGFVDITKHGATADDDSDDLAAIREAVSAARSAGTGVWIPEGRFVVTDRIDVQGVEIRGSGPWYSVLEGRDGKGGFFATGSDVTIADLMIDGDVRYRDDANFHAAMEGNFGTGSSIENIWVEHTKVGLWISSGTDGLTATGMRIRNTFADGVNMVGDVRNTRVEQSAIRNTGDDALAIWSNGSAVTNSGYAFNTVQSPMLGNGIGIYGGDSNYAEDNLISDTVTASAGIAVGTRFDPVPLSGETSIQRNTVIRTGGLEPNWQEQIGGLWIYAENSAIDAPITVRDMEIVDSTYQGIKISYQQTVEQLTFDHITIDGAGTWGIEVDASGGGYFTYVVVENASAGGLDVNGEFNVDRGPGNEGW